MLLSPSRAIGVVPDMMALTTSLPLRNGTRTMSMPCVFFSFSMNCTSTNENVP